MIHRGCGIMLALSVCLGAVGCMPSGMSPQAREHLDAAVLAYEQGDMPKTVSESEAVLAEHTGREAYAQAKYLHGLALLRLEQSAQAEKDLTEAFETTSSKDLRAKAADALGELAYVRGDLDLAAKRFQEAIAGTDSGEAPADHAQYRLACVYQRQGRWQDADLLLYRVVDGFEGSEIARRASQRAGARAWTIQVGSFVDRTHAEQDQRALAGLGLDIRVQTQVRQGKLVHVVQAGRWDRFESAAREVPRVRQQRADAFAQVTR